MPPSHLHSNQPPLFPFPSFSLGLYGPGTPFHGATTESSVALFCGALKNKGLTFLEMMAQQLKAEGSYLARSLSYMAVEFETEVTPLSLADVAVYDAATALWRDVIAAMEHKYQNAEPRDKGAKMRLTYGAQARFFKALTVSLKVPAVAALAREALERGDAVVIGLQGTVREMEEGKGGWGAGEGAKKREK